MFFVTDTLKSLMEHEVVVTVPPKLLFEGEVSGFIIGKKIFVVLFLMTLVTVTCYNITCLRM